MKKFLAVLAALALAVTLSLAPAAEAQNYYPSATTVTVSVTNGATYFQVFLSGNITTFGFTFGSEPPKPAVVWVVFTQNGSGSNTVGFASNVKGITIGSSANESTVEEFFYDLTTGDWFAVASQHT